MYSNSSKMTLEQVLAKLIASKDDSELLQYICAAACASTGSFSDEAGAAILLQDASGVRALAAYGKNIPLVENVADDGSTHIIARIPQMPPPWLLSVASTFPRVLAKNVQDMPLKAGKRNLHVVYAPIFSSDSQHISLALCISPEAFSKELVATMRVLQALASMAEKEARSRALIQKTQGELEKVRQEHKQVLAAKTSANVNAHEVQNALTIEQSELGTAIYIVSEVQQSQRYFEAAVTFCAAVATHLGLSRVALGEVSDYTAKSGPRRTRTFAIDQMEKFARGTRTVRLMEQAMDECLAQDTSISYCRHGDRHMTFAHENADIEGTSLGTPDNIPNTQEPQSNLVITAAAATFLRNAGGKALFALPLKVEGKARFVALFIAEKPFTQRDELTLRLASELSVPHLVGLAHGEEPYHRRFFRYTHLKLDDWFGPRHTALKVAMVCIAAFFVVTLSFKKTLIISAPLLIEGVHSYSQTSPVDSFLSEVHARTGDAVKAGDILGRVDDTELLLEKSAIETERKIHLAQAYQLSQEGKEAEASLARLEAQKDAVNLRWTEERLKMTALRSAVDGFLVSEDMFPRLGQPVRRGQELFEVADTSALRVVMHVAEDDIAPLRREQSQRGDFALTAYPDIQIPFTIDRIHPFAEVQAGINSFELRGAIASTSNAIPLRPGMEGIAHIYAGEHSILYNWTRKIVEKLTLFWWRI